MFGARLLTCDGRSGNWHARAGFDDPEQARKYEEIVELLQAAGYFRVRIAALTKFDKVVGGLAWAIANSGVAADVQVLFVENSTIGQKIKIADSIINALRKMRCPFPLASQVIQGSNFIELAPAMQWLVKKVLENRAEQGNYIRRFAELQFGKAHKLPEDRAKEQALTPARAYASSVAGKYAAKRTFRPTKSSRQRRADEQVSSVLLEFGHQYRLSSTESEDKDPAAEAARQAEMMASLARVGGKDTIATSLMGAMFGDKSQMRQFGEQNAAQAELLKQKALEEKAAQFAREKMSLERRIVTLEGELGALQATQDEAEARNEDGRTKLAAKVEYNERVIAETAKLLALETDENRELVARLRELLSLCDNLELQQAAFQDSCTAQKDELEAEILRLQTEGPPPEIAQRLQLLRETNAQDADKLVKLRAAFAKKIRDIAMVERRIDELPSQVELNQYQRRFIELYDQIALKLIETRRYFATYNTLLSTHEYLSKEVEYLESIQEQYPQYMRQKKTAPKEQFAAHVKSMNDGMVANLTRVEDRYATQKAERDALNGRYLQLVETQRAFFKLAKDFQDECAKNELLSSQLAEIGVLNYADEDEADDDEDEADGADGADGDGADA